MGPTKATVWDPPGTHPRVHGHCLGPLCSEQRPPAPTRTTRSTFSRKCEAAAPRRCTPRGRGRYRFPGVPEGSRPALPHLFPATPQEASCRALCAFQRSSSRSTRSPPGHPTSHPRHDVAWGSHVRHWHRQHQKAQHVRPLPEHVQLPYSSIFVR